MKNCKNQTLRIYKSENFYQENTGTCYEIFLENEIDKEYALNGFYHLDEDYDPAHEPSEWNRKYSKYGEDDFSNDQNEKVFDFKGSYEEEGAIYEQENWEVFCNDENFEAAKIDECQEILEWHDGSNWKKTVLWSDWAGDADGLERMEELEKCTYKQVFSTENGQGQGHDEYFEVFDENADHLMFVHCPVSYWQGEANNTYYEIEKPEIPEEAFQ